MKRSIHQLVRYYLRVSKKTKQFIIAVDGPGGAGKSHFSEKLSTLLMDCEIIHFDDFYLSESNPEIIGSNFDWKRLTEQVLYPLSQKTSSMYQIYDWPSNKLDKWKEVGIKKFVIVEGVTSGRLELRKYLNFIIFIETPFETRLNRGIERDSIEIKDKWLDEWVPMENKYFDSEIHQTKQSCNLIIDGTFCDNSKTDMIKTIYEKENYFE